MDERSLCRLAHQVVAPAYQPSAPALDAALPDFRSCPAYRADRCALAHSGAPCLFAELADSPGWQALRQHRLLPDGTVCTLDSYPVLLPLIASRPKDPAYRQLPDGTYCLAEHWDSINAILTRG